MPPTKLISAIKKAAKRGVDVRILTSGISDVPVSKLVSQYIYHEFLKSGVKIYEYYGRTLHAKTSTIDGIFSSIGTLNLDLLSGLKMLEVNVNILNRQAAQQLEMQFHEDLKLSKEITIDSLANRNIIQRFIYWLAYRLSRIFKAWLKL